MDNTIIFLFFVCIFTLAIFVATIFNRISKLEKINNDNCFREINRLKTAIDDLNTKFRTEKFLRQSLEDKVNNYKPYNEKERKEICEALERDMINTLKNVDKFIQDNK